MYNMSAPAPAAAAAAAAALQLFVEQSSPAHEPRRQRAAPPNLHI
jgi:hypothetical protein